MKKWGGLLTAERFALLFLGLILIADALGQFVYWPGLWRSL